MGLSILREKCYLSYSFLCKKDFIFPISIGAVGTYENIIFFYKSIV